MIKEIGTHAGMYTLILLAFQYVHRVIFLITGTRHIFEEIDISEMRSP